MKRATKSELVRVRMSPRDRKALERIAERFQMGKSETMRTLIHLYVAGFMGGAT